MITAFVWINGQVGKVPDLAQRLLDVEGVCAVFYDLTHKPPGTIEWE